MSVKDGFYPKHEKIKRRLEAPRRHLGNQSKSQWCGQLFFSFFNEGLGCDEGGGPWLRCIFRADNITRPGI